MATWQDKQTRIPIHSPRSHAAACSASTLLCRLVSGRGCTTVLHTRRAYSYCHIGDHSLFNSPSNPPVPYPDPHDLDRHLLSPQQSPHSEFDRMRPWASFLRACSLRVEAMPHPTDHAHTLSRDRDDQSGAAPPRPRIRVALADQSKSLSSFVLSNCSSL